VRHDDTVTENGRLGFAGRECVLYGSDAGAVWTLRMRYHGELFN
jgi:hypothetical protein